MFKIQTLNNISAFGLEKLPADLYEVSDTCENPDAYILRSYKMHDLDVPASVLAAARAGAGTNNIPSEDYAAKGIVVFNTPGANANAVKELVIIGMLLASRNIAPAIEFTAALTGEGAEFDKAVEGGKKKFAGSEISGKTLGVIGLGAIGGRVASAAYALGMKVVGYDPVISPDAVHDLDGDVRKVDTLEELFDAADFITVHVPLIGSTKGMVNAALLARMKPTGVVCNFSRGPIVDEEAMLAALDAGKLRSYVCDFPSPTLQGNPKVVALPHLGASTNEAEDNCAMMAADELRAYLEDGNIINSVNYPNMFWDRTGEKRVCVLSSASAAGAVVTALPGAHSSQRGAVAYTIADGADPAAVEGIEGVYRVRVLD